MYCPSCGKQIPDQSRFCFICGAAVPAQTSQPVTAPQVTEWEYRYYVRWWDLGDAGSFPLHDNQTETRARLEYWANHQKTFLPELQEYYDLGWEAISEIGPNAYNFRHHQNEGSYLVLKDFRVKLRRPKTNPTSPHLATLLGKWESVELIRHGLLANMMAGLGSEPGMYSKGFRYEFFTDYSFQGNSKDTNKFNRGIFTFLNGLKKFVIITDTTTLKFGAQVIVSEIISSSEFRIKTPDERLEIVYRKI